MRDVIEVAGIEVSRASMIALAHRLVLSGQNGTAARILDGLVNHDRITFESADRDAILIALDDPLDGLILLRAVLLQEHLGRQRAGLPSLQPRFEPAPSG